MEDNLIKINRGLYPLAWLYGLGVNFRNLLFDWGILRSRSFDIPVISVGNITVGGTGKTPHTEYLVRLLQSEFQVAVLSRGYKRKSKGFRLVETDMPVEQVGDEPYQMKSKFPDVYIAVDKDRCHGIDQLCSGQMGKDIEVVLLDDAFQHRYVQPGISILLVDYNRLIENDALLPAGRLREPASSKHRANMVIVTKCPDDIKPMDYRVLSKRLDLYPYQQLYFSTLRYGDLRPLTSDAASERVSLKDLSAEDEVLLFTGIASPVQMAADLERMSVRVRTMAFADHHFFSLKDIRRMEQVFQQMKAERKFIVTTEKDAVRLVRLPFLDESLKRHIYVLPIEIEFLQNQQDRFNQNIIGYVRKNKRNSILYQGTDANKS
ncbi:MAG: tetraacyldisaccharide 4'-kinase [Bacteroidaceae bacterium]